MTELKDISIIITHYNSLENIIPLIKHLKKQNKGFNYVIVDDCSKREIVNKIENEIVDSDNFTLISWRKNKGISKSRKDILKKIKTKYFCFLDCDDYLNLDMIEESLPKLKEDSINLLWKVIVRTDGKIETTAFVNEIDKKDYLLKSIWTIPGFIIPTKFQNQFDFLDNQNLGEDINLTTLICNNDVNMIKTTLPVYHYFIRSGSLSNQKAVDYTSLFNNIKNTLNNIKDKELKELMAAKFLSFYFGDLEPNDKIVSFENFIRTFAKGFGWIDKVFVINNYTNSKWMFKYWFNNYNFEDKEIDLLKTKLFARHNSWKENEKVEKDVVRLSKELYLEYFDK
ncbi:MAG: glycosyltransferase family 2 protein [Mycoplasma sp.]